MLCEYKFDEKQKKVLKISPSTDLNMLRLLSESFEFNFNLIDVNGSYGNYLNGKSFGTTGLISNQV